MSFSVLIPARYASSRLPGKALADLDGKPMVVRVAERARESGAARVVVATDDVRIEQAVRAHGIDVVPTRSDHPTGTDRLAEAAARLALPEDDIVVPTVHFTKENGELTSVAIDENTKLELVG